MRSRRRDRRGRGIRGPLAPPELPFTRSRSEQFDELVLDAMDRLEQRWPEELRDVEVAVEEVPPQKFLAADAVEARSPTWAGAGRIPLGRSFPAKGKRPARIVVYRRPVETRTRDPRVKGLLVHDVVVERVAELLGMAPELVDPNYGAAPGGHGRDDGRDD